MSNIQPGDRLELSVEEMRALGYKVVDILIEHFEHLGDKPVTRRSDRPTLEKRLREALPEQGTSAQEVLEQIVFNNIKRPFI
jgi:aromatic-L-amino-acid decarboxylase